MSGMTPIVKTITRLILGFIVVFSASVILYGHITPGGGFAGGSMLACGFVLLLLAFGKEGSRAVLTENGASIWDSLGAFAFLCIALLGYAAKAFFVNFLPHGAPFRLISAGTVMWSNIAIGIKVAACLFLIYLVLAAFRPSDST
jgi:multisubunit Na+/H+ antiporter MnhB subunit